ncbi:acyl-protein synthetase, LuxE [Paenibacillus alvei TS-15]|uniref:Acyl-protein synthetase, LuxE n=1 Tax=Paenibacillus alvei TS-15 TaxID=1117108 RepID=S9UBP7_PAEAL|nr:acyl-protein synthetase LuxE [Paenibacillus alvei]EPY07895.1 acyl-protein synthetase, LuxE [Paenibacillus alvei TS-15]
MDLEQLFKIDPYSMASSEKASFLKDELTRLTGYHYENCKEYKNIIDAFPDEKKNFCEVTEVPYLPVRLFKLLDLHSVEKSNVIKTLTSSGTTSQVVSKINIDKETSLLQTKALVNIVTSFIGGKRYPMILVDAPNVIQDRTQFSARGAGLMGLINFGRNHFYLLDENMEIKLKELEDFLEKHKDQPILLFGFTFMVWQYLYLACKEKNIHLKLNNGILIHSGGWKKLQEISVTNEVYKQKMNEQFGIDKAINFYGMVEQVGSIFMECEEGYLHAPNFADVIIRDPHTLEILEQGLQGIVQVISVLPKSYPGHSLLTEDLGTVYGEDNCKCGRKGKYFHIHGRLPSAELRGCSDTHAYNRGE